MTALHIGIDLGTTNSLIAQFIDGETRLIPNRLGHMLTPSAVSMAEDGSILVGLAARERLSTAPGYTATAFKRFMGTDKRFRLGNRRRAFSAYSKKPEGRCRSLFTARSSGCCHHRAGLF